MTDKKRSYLARYDKVIEGNFYKNLGGYDAIAIPWPEDCPWDIEDFPLPGEEVESEMRRVHTIVGLPRLISGRWRVPTTSRSIAAFPKWRVCSHFPSIWDARKEEKPYMVNVTNYGAMGDRSPTIQILPGQKIEIHSQRHGAGTMIVEGIGKEKPEVVGTLNVGAGEGKFIQLEEPLELGLYDIVKQQEDTHGS